MSEDTTQKEIRGDLPEFFDDDLVQGWIHRQADKDPRLEQAWNDRFDNPKGFERVAVNLRRDFAKRYGKLPDKGATEDRDSVTHAVRGASTQAPEGKAPDYSRMSDNDFQQEKLKMFGG